MPWRLTLVIKEPGDGFNDSDLEKAMQLYWSQQKSCEALMESMKGVQERNLLAPIIARIFKAKSMLLHFQQNKSDRVDR